MRGRLQLQLDRTLEPQAQQLLRVPDQEVDGPVRPRPADDGRDPDEVVLSLDDDLSKGHKTSRNQLQACNLLQA